MKINHFLSSPTFISLPLLILICHFSSAKTLTVNGEQVAINGKLLQDQEDAKRSHFPDGFLFGVSTSAYQIEGAILEDGKGYSDWDAFVHKRGQNTPNGDVANDHYHRFMAIPGELGFIAQLNEGRHLKKRPTELRVDRVLQPFDETKFNFTEL